MTRLGDPRRIIVRSTNWIGDVVMSIPALKEIRRIYPDAHLAVFARDWVADLYRGQEFVDEVLSFPSRRSSLRYLSLFRGFDLAILFQNAFEAALLALLGNIPRRVGYATHYRKLLLTSSVLPRTPGLGLHQVYYYLDLLFQLGLSETDYLHNTAFRPDISLEATKPGRERAGALMRQQGVRDRETLIGMNPGATFGPAKRWLEDRYAALADRLSRELNARIVMVGSASERPLAEKIEAAMSEKPVILSGNTDLQTLMGVIASCRLFITNDSGPMHLAAALDIPQIALFGSTDETATGPFSTHAQVIHKHVECSPCLKRQCPIDLRCFTRISVDEVFENAQRIMQSETQTSTLPRP